MPTRKVCDHVIEVKKGFVPRKGKVYPLSREEREEVREFIKEQLRKGYIRLSKSPQIALVFFVGKKMERNRWCCYDRCLLESTWTWVKGMMTTISCAEVVSVSTSCSRHCNLT